MAAQQPNQAGSTPTAQLIGNAFVNQYYHILHSSPDLVHRFYQESSKLGRPDASNTMVSVTTIEAINDKIMSMEVVKAEIASVDAQESLSGGVIVLVTGYLTGRQDNVRREFTQTFFLAPQEKGFFVLNDLFRFTGASVIPIAEHHESSADSHVLASGEGLANGTAVHYQTEHEAVLHVHHIERGVADEVTNEEEVYNPSENEGSTVEEPQIPEVIDEVPENNALAPPSQDVPISVSSMVLTTGAPVIATTVATNDDAPKKSYASILKDKMNKDNATSLSAPTYAPRSAPVQVPRSSAPAPKVEKQVSASAPAPSPVADTPAFSSNASDSNTVQELEDGHSIYVKNLPINATPQQLEEEFKKYGAIRTGGIQVRSHKAQGFCYGFVEFEEASAIQSAVEASPVTIAGRQCFVEEKRASGPRGGGRGRFGGGRGGSGGGGANFRNEGPRGGRGGGGGGSSYGGGSGNRGGYGRSGDFRGGNRGARGTGGDYQKVDNSTGGGGPRGPRPPAPNATASSK